jgi:hypothetical protein
VLHISLARIFICISPNFNATFGRLTSRTLVNHVHRNGGNALVGEARYGQSRLLGISAFASGRGLLKVKRVNLTLLDLQRPELA